MRFLRRWWAGSTPRPRSFRDTYRHFRELVEANHRALAVISDISDLLAAREPFTMGTVRRCVHEALDHTRHEISCLLDMTGGRHDVLWDRLADIADRCKAILIPHADCPEGHRCPDRTCRACTHRGQRPETRPYVYDLSEVGAAHMAEVGEKMARLGEIRRVLGLAAPEGFCLTVRCFNEFLSANRLRRQMRKIKDTLDFRDASAVQEASRAIQGLIVAAPIPRTVEAAILGAHDRLAARLGHEPRLAVRSSAVGEDAQDHSFAGLHHTALNIGRDNLVDACWEVLVSKYLPQSLAYRYVNGLRDEDMPMSVGCMVMVDAAAGGTLFTRDPEGVEDGMLIHAARGLGLAVVEGRTQPQEFIVERECPGQLLHFRPGNQTELTRSRQGEGLEVLPVDDQMRGQPCLSEPQLAELARAGMAVEKLFGRPQDIEWAVDPAGRLQILQARPLEIRQEAPSPAPVANAHQKSCPLYPVLVQGGQRVGGGVGVGPVFVAARTQDLVAFPEGGVLVTKRTTPDLASVLHKASAMVCEAGSTTGHAAIIAREFGVPSLVNVPEATRRLPPGVVVTVDARRRRVYQGRVVELLDDRDERRVPPRFVRSPVYNTLKALAESIVPLHLTDPRSESFKAGSCRSLHDITRVCHEVAIDEMFRIGRDASQDEKQARRLSSSVPLEIYVIDVDGGLHERGRPTVELDDVASKPFRFLLTGMTSPGVRWSGPVPMDMRGFVGLVMNTMMDADRAEVEVGARSYAIIAADYLNFFSRLGYHFSTIDVLAGAVPEANHATFHFRGGAANPTRRTRRASFVGRVLENLGFTVEQKADSVFGRLQHVEEGPLLETVEQLGRLMGATRNIDVTMCTDDQIATYAEAFLSGHSTPADAQAAP